MLTETTVTIGDKAYVLKTVPNGEARPLYFRLLKICGPALVRALRSGVTNFTSLKDLGTRGVAADALEELLSRLTEDDFELFVATFAKHTTQSGVQLSTIINTLAFAGHPGHQLVWLGECLKFTFASFLADLGAISLPG